MGGGSSDSAGGSESTVEDAGGGEASADNSGSEAGDDGILNPGGTYPVVKEGTLEMSMFTMSMPNVEDFATNDFTKYLEELTGIKMEFMTGSRQEWKEKLNALLSSGEYPDIIFGVSPDLAKYGAGEGIIIPLDDYLTEENVPNYLKMMEQYGLDMTKEADGKIYSLANINDCYHCNYGRKMWVNTYYLEQMNCEIPTTTDEFIDVCQKFLEFKPDGIAVLGGTSGWFVRMRDWLLGAYEYIPGGSSTTATRDHMALNKTTNKIECTAVTDNYREGLKFLNELYEMGAIYENDLAQNAEAMKTLVNQADEPVLFFPAGTISDMIDSDSNNELYRHYECMAPIAGPDGTRIAWYAGDESGVSSGAFCITDNCENIEAALRWVDFFYGETGDLCSQYGAEEGVDWVLNPEGKVGLNGEPALYEVLNVYSGEAQNHDWQDVGIRVAPAYYRLGQAVDADVDPYAPEGLERLLYDASAKLYAPYAGKSDYEELTELKVTDQENTDLGTIPTEISKLISETGAAFITGTKDINSDAEWEAYLSDLDKAGLTTLQEFYQTAYDRTHAQ